MDIKENLAQNLTRLRKAEGLTQAELAEKLNYSDKAVSKWERGESFPDLYVIKQLADFYCVTIDALISESLLEKPKMVQNKGKRRFIIAMCSTGLVWLVAITCFALLKIVTNIEHTWMSFIYAIPISMIVLLVLIDEYVLILLFLYFLFLLIV